MKKAQPPKTAMRRSAGIRHKESNKSEFVRNRNLEFAEEYDG